MLSMLHYYFKKKKNLSLAFSVCGCICVCECSGKGVYRKVNHQNMTEKVTLKLLSAYYFPHKTQCIVRADKEEETRKTMYF